jgi:hypothetical protein
MYMIYKPQKRGALGYIWAVAPQKEVEISTRRPVVLRIFVGFRSHFRHFLR